MRKVRWGVLSVARIGVDKVIPGMQRGKLCEVVAIASRSLDRAQAAAQKLGLPKAYGTYEELLADPEIDAIYNPLPNHLHVPWSVKALEAGKHVLCEKPIALTSQEAESLVDAGKRHPQLKLMEAFMYRHHPQWVAARRFVTEGRIGALRAVQTLFSYHNVNRDDIRNQPEIGGGGLMDIGCYPISLSRFLFNREPVRVCGWIELDPEFQTDRLASAMLDFGDGISSFTCSTQLYPHQRVTIMGDAGEVEIEIPFNAPPDRPCRVRLATGEATATIDFATADQYGTQGDLFSRAILEKTPVPTPIEDAIANMRVIEALFRSARKGAWETLAAQ